MEPTHRMLNDPELKTLAKFFTLPQYEIDSTISMLFDDGYDGLFDLLPLLEKEGVLFLHDDPEFGRQVMISGFDYKVRSESTKVGKNGRSYPIYERRGSSVALPMRLAWAVFDEVFECAVDLKSLPKLPSDVVASEYGELPGCVRPTYVSVGEHARLESLIERTQKK